MSSKRMAMGTILYSIVDGEIRYCLVKRTFGYGMCSILTADFWNTDVFDCTCFDEISTLEREALLSLCSMGEKGEDYYAQVWRLAFDRSSTSNSYKRHFHTFLNKRAFIQQQLKKAISICPYGTWGFPKGGCKGGETELESALRETTEETTIRRKHIKLDSMQPLMETYKYWTYKYFVGRVNEKFAKDYICEITHEVSLVAWCTLEEALQLFPTDAIERKRVLEYINETLRNRVK